MKNSEIETKMETKLKTLADIEFEDKDEYPLTLLAETDELRETARAWGGCHWVNDVGKYGIKSEMLVCKACLKEKEQGKTHH